MKSNKWWTTELTQMRQLVCTARRKFQRNQTSIRQQLYKQYQNLNKSYKTLIEKTKNQSWNEFLQTSSSQNPWSLAYKIAKDKIFSPKLSELIDNNGDLITDEKDISDKLFTKLFPLDDTNTDSDKHKQIRAQSQLHSTVANDKCFTLNEVNIIVNQQNSKKSPGADGFTADIIQIVHNERPNFLLDIYNRCLELNYFPRIWKNSVIKIIPKPNKSDYRDANSYRPISLLSVYAKIFEKLLINRILDNLYKNNNLNRNQRGFTQQTGTEDALISLTKFIEETFQEKGFAIVLSLDIDGAFNGCWWPKIINQLRIKGCPNNLLEVVKSYFKDRESSLWFLNTQTSRSMNMGCPQGSASGPGFWNISIDDIFELTADMEDCHIECFADDIVVKIFAKTAEEVEFKANTLLIKLQNWALDSKISFSVSKTNCILFTRNLKYKKPEIKFDGKDVKLSTHFKHLGVIIDNKLCWRQHTQYVMEKVSKFTNRLLRFAKIKYGLDSRALEVIFKGAILPMTGYAIPVWYKALDKRYLLNPLENLQRLIAIRFIKGYKTVSYDAANVLANFTPIDIFLKGKATEYFVKKGLKNDLKDIYLGTDHIDLNEVQRPEPFERLLPINERNPLKSVNTIETNACLLKVNSYKTSTEVGSALIIVNSDIEIKKKYKLRHLCSTFQAILVAVLNGLEFTFKLKRERNIVIMTSNRQLLCALRDPNSTNPLVVKIFEIIHKLRLAMITCNIKLVNKEEVQDIYKLAKEAAKSHQSFCYDLIPINYVKKVIREKSIDLWEKRWSETTKGEQTKQYFQTVIERKDIKKYFKSDFCLTQALTNHGNLNSYLHRFKIKEFNHCNHCQDTLEDNANHRIFTCTRYQEERNLLIDVLESKRIQWPTDHRNLLKPDIFECFKQFCNNVFI